MKPFFGQDGRSDCLLACQATTSNTCLKVYVTRDPSANSLVASPYPDREQQVASDRDRAKGHGHGHVYAKGAWSRNKFAPCADRR